MNKSFLGLHFHVRRLRILSLHPAPLLVFLYACQMGGCCEEGKAAASSSRTWNESLYKIHPPPSLSLTQQRNSLRVCSSRPSSWWQKQTYVCTYQSAAGRGNPILLLSYLFLLQALNIAINSAAVCTRRSYMSDACLSKQKKAWQAFPFPDACWREKERRNSPSVSLSQHLLTVDAAAMIIPMGCCCCACSLCVSTRVGGTQSLDFPPPPSFSCRSSIVESSIAAAHLLQFYFLMYTRTRSGPDTA